MDDYIEYVFCYTETYDKNGNARGFLRVTPHDEETASVLAKVRDEAIYFIAPIVATTDTNDLYYNPPDCEQ